MSLPDILLSLLREPMSGSELIRLFQSTISHFWKTDLSQIYKALEGLERDGSLRSRSHPSSKGPTKRVYRLTARGRRRLAEWIRRPPSVPPAKFEYLAQLFSVTAEERPRESAKEILNSIRGEAAAAVVALERIDAQFQQASGSPETLPGFLFYPWLTLRHGLIRRRAMLEWIDESLGYLEHRPDSAETAADDEAMTDLVEALLLVADDSRAPKRQEQAARKKNSKQDR